MDHYSISMLRYSVQVHLYSSLHSPVLPGIVMVMSDDNEEEETSMSSFVLHFHKSIPDVVSTWSERCQGICAAWFSDIGNAHYPLLHKNLSTASWISQSILSRRFMVCRCRFVWNQAYQFIGWQSRRNENCSAIGKTYRS